MPIESAKTSINQIPAGLRHLASIPHTNNSVNIDFGGGAYDTGTEFLKSSGIVNFVYDPYNRSLAHNSEVMSLYQRMGADSCTLLNVLNVIPTRAERFELLDLIVMNMRPKTTLIIGVYEGDRTGIIKRTSKGWQMNATKAFYRKELQDAYRKGFISISNDKQFLIVRRLK